MITNILFGFLVLLIVWVSYKLGYAACYTRVSNNLPTYKALYIQQIILSLARMDYIKIRESNTEELELITISEIEGNLNVTEGNRQSEKET